MKKYTHLSSLKLFSVQINHGKPNHRNYKHKTYTFFSTPGLYTQTCINVCIYLQIHINTVCMNILYIYIHTWQLLLLLRSRSYLNSAYKTDHFSLETVKRNHYISLSRGQGLSVIWIHSRLVFLVMICLV